MFIVTATSCWAFIVHLGQKQCKKKKKKKHCALGKSPTGVPAVFHLSGSYKTCRVECSKAQLWLQTSPPARTDPTAYCLYHLKKSQQWAKVRSLGTKQLDQKKRGGGGALANHGHLCAHVCRRGLIALSSHDWLEKACISLRSL